MLQLSNGVIFPGFIIYLILYIIMRLMPDSFVRFQKHHAPMSFPIVNFSLPFRSVYKELHADHETGAADNK